MAGVVAAETVAGVALYIIGTVFRVGEGEGWKRWVGKVVPAGGQGRRSIVETMATVVVVVVVFVCIDSSCCCCCC